MSDDQCRVPDPIRMPPSIFPVRFTIGTSCKEGEA